MPSSLARSLFCLTHKIPCYTKQSDCLLALLCRNFTQRAHHAYCTSSHHRLYEDVIGEESIKKYRLGGFHPVVLGNTFHNGRYQVLHKLGHGSYSTVWLAQDRELERYVALKICTADYDDVDREYSILRVIANLPKTDPGWKFIHSVMDSFEHQGPNGTHQCLVLEPLGPSLGKVAYDHSRMLQGNIKLVKRFAKQVLLAIAFLHKNNIIHADIHTGNIAIQVPSINSIPPEELVDKLGVLRPEPLIYTDKSPVCSTDVCVPQFMYESVDALSWEHNFEDVECVKVIDFGNAFFSNSAPSNISVPIALRPPEVIMGDILSEKVDVWAAGCLIFELATSEAPFDYFCRGNADVLRQITSDLGPVPERWQRDWAATIERDQRIRCMHIVQDQEAMDFAAIFRRTCEGRNYDYSEDEVAGLLRNVRRMMRVDPMERPSIVEILDDPFWVDA